MRGYASWTIWPDHSFGCLARHLYHAIQTEQIEHQMARMVIVPDPVGVWLVSHLPISIQDPKRVTMGR